jgi:excisionase family DNA binding protein
MSRKGDVTGFRKILRTYPDGIVFNRLTLPTTYRDKWVMNDLVRRGFLISLGENIYQKTTRKNAFRKRKPNRKRIAVGGPAGRFTKVALGTGRFETISPFGRKRVINNPDRAVEIFEMRAGKNGKTPASYQDIANRFDISRQRVGQILTKNGVAGRVSLKDPNFLTTTEAAKYLSVSYRSIFDWSKVGALPFYEKKHGKIVRLLFRKEDLDTYHDEHLIKPHKRISKEVQGLRPLVERLLELGDRPQELAKLSGIGLTTIYNWYYSMPGRDKRIGQAMEKILEGPAIVE